MGLIKALSKKASGFGIADDLKSSLHKQGSTSGHLKKQETASDK